MAVEEKTVAQHAAENEESEARSLIGLVYGDSITTNSEAAQAATAHALLAISHRLADLVDAVRENTLGTYEASGKF